jgi:GH25 family lysozyme M1 (1,4-beta-N-acetylmuramidase)
MPIIYTYKYPYQERQKYWDEQASFYIAEEVDDDEKKDDKTPPEN